MNIGIEILSNLSSLKVKLLNAERGVVFFRWLFVFVLFPIFFLLSEPRINTWKFFALFAVLIIYNRLATLSIISKKGRRKKLLTIFTYADIVIVSMFSYFFGGITSDVYLLLLFIIGYFGVTNSASAHVADISILSVAAYSISNLFFNIVHSLSMSAYMQLLFRDMLILLGSYGIYLITTEVQKYDKLHKKEFQLARTDKLTGLSNRHLLEQKLGEEAARADVSGKTLSILIFDLDNFKNFNDSYGHILGDKLLELFATILLQNIRTGDVPVRYGGEEFLLLLRDLDLNAAKKIGDRIRSQLEKQSIHIGSSKAVVKVTVSCGIAQYPVHSNSVQKVIDLADKALYQAKGSGKNKVISYGEIPCQNNYK